MTASARSRSPSGFPDPTPINLNRLLSRLERAVLEAPSPQLRSSSYERARVGANIEHARTLLLSLEHSAASLPTKSKKSALQADLQKKRDLIKQLNQRLYELNQLDDDSGTGGSADSEDDEDRFPSYAPHVQADAGIDVTTSGKQGDEALQNAAQSLGAQLRRRGGAEASAPATAATATTTGNGLFPSKPTTTTGDISSAQTDVLLSHHRTEQDALTNSLLEMARQLKQQSVNFGQALEGDKSVLDRTVSGLDKSSQGMEAAGQRIGTLRRMTEGRGWWARMKLYGMIFGLWVVILLVMFVLPKIRF